MPKDYSATGLVVRESNLVRDQVEAAQRESKEEWKQTMARLERERDPLAKGTEFKKAAAKAQ
eukprot:8496262-Pyramimonas_sp.AAC.1